MRMTGRGVLAALALLAVSGGGLVSAGGAQAVVVHPLLRSFGPGGFDAEGPVGAFASAQGVAVDESSGRETSGDVYVYDAGAGAVYKFDAEGEPAAFSKLAEEGSEHPDALTELGGGTNGENEIAVDSSTGPDAGDIYIANNSTVAVYSATGEKLEELTGGEACGVAVDPAGHVFVGFYPGTVEEYTPVTNPVTDANLTGSSTATLNSICNVAVDGKGNVYPATYNGGVARLEGLSAASATAVDAAGSTLAVDPFSGEVYVDEGSGIAVYKETAGVLGRVETFAASGVGALSGSFGIAVNGTSAGGASGDVYADDGGVVEVFGPPITLPDIATGAVSNVTGETVTLEGTVTPEGVEVTTCVFQWGESESYEHETPCTALPGSGNAPVTVHVGLVDLAPNTPYHYRLVASNQNGEGTPGADQSFATQPVAPAITGPAPFASGVSQLAATLNATVDPLGALTSYHFEYGPTAAYGSVVPEPDLYLPIDSGDHEVSQALTGLQAGTTYHFALVANSAGGTQTSPDETFTTPAIPLPVIGVGAASGATEGAVTLVGAIDPGGWETTYTFQYGTSTAYGQQWPTLPVALGGLSGAQPVTIYLEGLLPATTYHYRLVASNGGGTAYGPDETFTTAAYPLSVVQEPLILQPPPGAKGVSSGSGSSKSAGKGKGKKGKGKEGKGRQGGKRRRRVSRGKAKRARGARRGG
jgi:hypothetical protein